MLSQSAWLWFATRLTAGALAVSLTPLEAATDSIRLRLLAGAPVVDGVYLDGHGPYRFVVDTGAQRSRIALDLVQELGWTPAFESRVVTVTNDALRSGYRAGRLSLGKVETRDEEFVAGSFAAFQDLDPEIRGTLGQSFLRKLDYLIDFRHKRLRIGSAEVRGGVRTRFDLANGCMVTETSHGQLTLDSGATAVILFDNRTVEWTGTRAVLTTEGKGEIKVGELRSFRVGGKEFNRVDAAESPRARLNQEHSDGLMPASLFSSLYVSNSGGYVVFDPEN